MAKKVLLSLVAICLVLGGVDYWWQQRSVTTMPQLIVENTTTTNVTTDPTLPASTITSEQVRIAGFDRLQSIKKDHSLFQIELPTTFDVLKSYLYYNDYPLGVIYDIGGDYNDLLSELAKNRKIYVNVTDSFGDASFYVNKENNTRSAFLVIKKGIHLWGFEYLKDNHHQLMELIRVLDTD